MDNSRTFREFPVDSERPALIASTPMAYSTKPSLSWLLVFVPVTLVIHYAFPAYETAAFITSCIAIIPLAGWMGRATEHLAARTGDAIGGLLNATFGNAAELIIALSALHKGYTEVVKASLTGSIIGNILLVLGLACFAGGLRYQNQDFNVTGARTQATMLLLAAIGLIIPAIFHHLAPGHAQSEQSLSVEISCVLLIVYALSLLFSLRTHKQLFSGAATDQEDGDLHHLDEPEWSTKKSVTVLLIATAGVAWIAEILVASVEHAAHAFGMSNIFVGVIVVAIVGNAAEHSTAVLVAMKNRMDLSLGIAIGSSIQIALFAAPFLVLMSYLIAPEPMDLVFTPAEVLAVTLSVWIVGQVAGDGKSNWFEGIQLLSVYAMLAMIFYFLPEHVAGGEAAGGH